MKELKKINKNIANIIEKEIYDDNTGGMLYENTEEILNWVDKEEKFKNFVKEQLNQNTNY